MSTTTAGTSQPVTYERPIQAVDDDGLALRVVGGRAVELDDEVFAVLTHLTRVLDPTQITPGLDVGTIELTPATGLVQYHIDPEVHR